MTITCGVTTEKPFGQVQGESRSGTWTEMCIRPKPCPDHPEYDLSTPEGRQAALNRATALINDGHDLTRWGRALLDQAVQATETALREHR